MKNRLFQCIRSKHIDSFQKLYVLLFLYHHPRLTGTNREIARQLYFGDEVGLTKIITDLEGAGLVEQAEGRYKLCNQPDIQVCLQNLAKAFDDPLTRQKILDKIISQPSTSDVVSKLIIGSGHPAPSTQNI